MFSEGSTLMLRATDMGNQYAPYFAARLFLSGEGDVPADPARARNLLDLSARRGFEDAYLDLAKGYRDGAFAGKADLRLAYFNAELAVRFKVEGAEKVRELRSREACR